MSGMGRILLLGAGGQLGRELRRSFAAAGDLICPDRKSLNLEDETNLRQVVRSVEPQIILNAAAYTAVDRAESEPELAMAVNARAPRVLAEEALRHRALLVHYSTDYVFDGSKNGPWLENDRTNPLNVYGASKLAGEDAIRTVGGNHLIFRTSWVYGPHGNNFLLTMLRLGHERDLLRVVDDQIGAPTSSIEIADTTRLILDGIFSGRFGEAEGWSGLYHLTCGGSISWCGFAREIFALSKERADGHIPDIQPIASSDYPTAARRPLNSVLSNQKLHKVFHVQMAAWQKALAFVMQALPR